VVSRSVVAQTTTPLRRVLVLYSDERLLPASMIVGETILATFAADASKRIEFHSEFLDVYRFPGEAQQRRQRDFFRDKCNDSIIFPQQSQQKCARYLRDAPNQFGRSVDQRLCPFSNAPSSSPEPEPHLEMALRAHADGESDLHHAKRPHPSHRCSRHHHDEVLKKVELSNAWKLVPHERETKF
jgi:hypothetical protein